MNTIPVDILESKIPKDILEILLHDHTTQRNIFWATKDYEQLGEGFPVLEGFKPLRFSIWLKTLQNLSAITKISVTLSLVSIAIIVFALTLAL